MSNIANKANSTADDVLKGADNAVESTGDFANDTLDKAGRKVRELIKRKLPVPRPLAACYLREGVGYRAALLMERLENGRAFIGGKPPGRFRASITTKRTLVQAAAQGGA